MSQTATFKPATKRKCCIECGLPLALYPAAAGQPGTCSECCRRIEPVCTCDRCGRLLGKGDCARNLATKRGDLLPRWCVQCLIWRCQRRAKSLRGEEVGATDEERDMLYGQREKIEDIIGALRWNQLRKAADLLSDVATSLF
ncbi:MAG: hypothetical protein ACK5Q5_22420 [Planctomycetaceae bacterium]